MIAVLGSTGKTGSALVNLLAERGVDFRCVVRDPQRAATILGKDVALIHGDLDRPETLANAFARADKLFLLSSTNPDFERQQMDAIDAAKVAGVQFVVQISGAEKCMRADSPVENQRAMFHVENHLKASALDWTILRPNFFMQNLLMAAPVVTAEGKLVNPVPGDVVINMIDVRDTAEVAARVLTEDGHQGRTYALNGPPATFKECAAALGDAVGREIALVTVPKEAVIAKMREAAAPNWQIDHVSSITDVVSRGETTGDGAVLAELLGRAPSTVQVFARDYKAAFGG